MLRMNGSLTRPLMATGGNLQGCSLSGLLYSVTIEPLLALVRKRMIGVAVPESPHVAPVNLTAYADDVT